jgi:hypothetical protein
MENTLFAPSAIIFVLSLGSLVYFMAFVLKGKAPKMRNL